MGRKINIRPTTSVYATYKNIKYDPWTAIAEFVDNSTQSYYSNESSLKKIKYWNGLKIDITYEKDENGHYYLEIKDNAYGMNFDDFKRAIILDSKPKIITRSEFGMGLKTAACWFGTNWSVQSTELNSDVQYYAEVDVDILSKYKNEEIEVEEKHCNPKEHGTIIRIWNLNRTIGSRQIGKMKDQLRGMYRVDLRSGEIQISYNGDPLHFEDAKVYEEKLPDGNIKKWKKNIAFEIENQGLIYHVDGFVGILETGNVSGAGFSLIRRGRVIVGGYENCYRPEEIFGKSNSFAYQRIFGELNLDDWPVTQTKDAFDWYNGLEDLLVEKLKENCDDYVKKSESIKKRNTKKTNIEKGINSLVDSFTQGKVIENVTISNLSDELREKIKEDSKKSPDKNDDLELKKEENELIIEDEHDDKVKGRKISFRYSDNDYIFNFILREDDPEATWLNIEDGEEGYIIQLNTRHPFFNPYMSEPEFLEIMEKFAFAFALAEIESRKTATNNLISASRIRLKMNESLKSVISKE